MFQTLKSKTIASFGAIIITSIIVVSILLFNINQMAQTTQNFYTQPYTSINHLWSMRRDVIDLQRILNKLMLTTPTKLVAEVPSAKKNIDEDTLSIKKAIEAMYILAAGKTEQIQLLDNINANILKSDTIQTEFMNLISAGNTNEGLLLLRNEYEPTLQSAIDPLLKLFTISNEKALEFVDTSTTKRNNSMLFCFSLTIFMVIVSMISLNLYLRGIIVPLRQVAHAAIEMSNGNLKVADQITYHSKDELGKLADSQRVLAERVSEYISRISSTLHSLSSGDLNIDYTEDFLGDFLPIQASTRKLVNSLNEALGEIRQSAIQLDISSSQISNASQGLSQGTSEQASSLDILVNTITDISKRIQDTAKNSQSAFEQTNASGEEMTSCQQQMQEMNNAMRNINKQSQEISTIMKTIEDIAFQSNILALNAAVEASRAGVAGKGFAVVADEVENLANKSSEASKYTSTLIADSIQAVEYGTKIADKTTKSLLNVLNSAKSVVVSVEEISSASIEEAKSIEEIADAINKISNVVQLNSSTAEESAAASEELSGQAQMLKGLVGRFQLRQSSQYSQSFESKEYANTNYSLKY